MEVLVAKHTKTASGLDLTASGKLQIPKDKLPFDMSNGGWNLDLSRRTVGDRVWQFTHSRKMSKRSVGTVVADTTPFTSNSDNKEWDTPTTIANLGRVERMENLNGDVIPLWENVILEEVVYQDAKNIL
jgi:hypothetical protein